MLDELREAVCETNKQLTKQGLVTMHSGNASGRDPDSGRVLIKPSGVDYDKLTPEMLVMTDADGNVIDSDLCPSVDLPHHLYLYKHSGEINSVIHTHSNYATSFAMLEESIKVWLTAIADEFGAEIPCVPYVDNVGDHIGEAILKNMGKAPAVLLGKHGVFAWGNNCQAAVKAAVMVEDVAKTSHLALLRGKPEPIPPEEAQKWYSRYHTTYGQQS